MNEMFNRLQNIAKTQPEKAIEYMRCSSDIEKIAIKLNEKYRAGEPIVEDWFYDQIVMKAVELSNPDSLLLKRVEPDVAVGKTIPLPERMLSTNKAYSIDEIEKWIESVIDAGNKIGCRTDNLEFRVTPKLDGFAAYDDGKTLYTRGDGRSGTDISRAIDNNDLYVCTRGLGAGEIVVDKDYFKKHLSPHFENSRNIIAGVIKEGIIDEKIKDAIALGKVRFFPFKELAGWVGNRRELINSIEALWEHFAKCPFDTDGLVIEITHEKIKKAMGDTNHHHRWQIAFKKNTEFHDIRVTGLVWQTSKNGRLTPVVQLEPTKVSGVTISRATGHHAYNVIEHGIDTDAIVRVCRSGLVIPYIERVIKPASEVKIPEKCPSCGSKTELVGDNLLCSNTETCPAQIEGRIEFFFKTLGNCDGFGPKVIEQLCDVIGVRSVGGIYTMTRLCFSRAGFGEKTCDNLFEELKYSRQRPIEDWRFLAAFSIHNIGKGGCEKLLKHHRLKDIFNLTEEDIIAIDGFAEKSAQSLIKSLIRIKPVFNTLMSLGFNLIETPLDSDALVIDSPIAGKVVVFTGSMQKGKRGDMEKEAKLMGAKVSSAVSSKTDYLIAGENVGASKTESAKKNGTTVLTEDEYLTLIGKAA
jgi:DNA ligase (NAD+)